MICIYSAYNEHTNFILVTHTEISPCILDKGNLKCSLQRINFMYKYNSYSVTFIKKKTTKKTQFFISKTFMTSNLNIPEVKLGIWDNNLWLNPIFNLPVGN